MILRPRQRVFVERALGALREHRNTLGVAPTGCHAPGTPILLFDGTVKPVEDIHVGDILMGPGSRPRTVLELHRGMDDMYEIRPMKGESFLVNRGHVLTLVRTNDGYNKRGPSRESELVDISVQAWLESSTTFRHLHKLIRLPVDFSVQGTPPIDPYFLGVLLGDGHLVRSVSVTTPDVEIVDCIHQQGKHWNLEVRCEQIPGNLANTYFVHGSRGETNPLIEALRALGVHGKRSAEKFVPEIYRLGSRDVRYGILAGLLDTDGNLSRPGTFEFSSRSKRLADDVVFIARSLGCLATRREKEVNGVIYWRVHLSGDLDKIPNRVIRKQAPPRKQRKNVLRTGFTVHPSGHGEYFGFSVDGDHRYLMGDFTLTHNSGKTIMLSGVTGEFLKNADAKACVLAHRDELTGQNQSKFRKVNPAITTSVVDARDKSWGGQTTFAMVPTLARDSNLRQMPALDLLVIDEAHHVAATSYRRIIDHARDKNPDVAIFGVTATPNRGDKKGLRPVFSNVADQITLGELIRSGHLVPPRTFVIDVGTQEALSHVKRTVDDFDMKAVDAIMNQKPVTDAVIRHWREKASGRKTVVFCSTVDHATNVTEAFIDAGVPAVLVHGELSSADRKAALARYETGDARVIVNVAVLTEGYDHPPTDCVVLLRPSSYKSTLIQMVGRGLRTVDPTEYPGVTKTDCIVLDFGTSSLLHGSLEQDVNLDGHEGSGAAPMKDCPGCGAQVPLASRECPLCGYVWEGEEIEDDVALTDFVMTEVDLLKRSAFRWCDLFSDDAALMATGFDAWGGVFFLNGRWYGVGGGKNLPARLLAIGDRTVCLAAADDWLNEHESDDTANKSKRWLNQEPTSQQLQYLPAALRSDFSLTRYRASCLLSFYFNKRAIQQQVFGAEKVREAA